MDLDAVTALKKLKRRFTRLIDASKKLQKFNARISRSKNVTALKVYSVPVVICSNCCHVLERPGMPDGLTFLLAPIYRNIIYPLQNISFIEGPVCVKGEDVLMLSSFYSQKPPDTSFYSIDDVDDGIDAIHLNVFRYRTLSEKKYDLLLTAPQPFASLFTGVGQVLPVNYSQFPSDVYVQL